MCGPRCVYGEVRDLGLRATRAHKRKDQTALLFKSLVPTTIWEEMESIDQGMWKQAHEMKEMLSFWAASRAILWENWHQPRAENLVKDQDTDDIRSLVQINKKPSL